VKRNDDVMPVAEGDIVAGKYRVERVLGRGGMGVVVSAMHLELQQRVALKFLLGDVASHQEEAARFGREARASARIRSDHVVRVMDVGTLPTGSPYMVMEYMDGDDLERVLERRGPLPWDAAVGYILEACEAVAEAHSLGIVHRDLKPANLFLARGPSGTPVVKVLDFGISKQAPGLGEASLTKTTAVMGSPRYMSPEQLKSSKTVDTRSDIWALGAVLYELLVHAYPFPAETMSELVACVLQEPHIRLSTLRSDLPSGLEAVVDHCLEKNPTLRFANIAEFAVALAPFGPPRSEVSVERIVRTLGANAVPAGVVPIASTFQSVADRSSRPSMTSRSGALAVSGDVPKTTDAQWARSLSPDAGRRSKAPFIISAIAVGTVTTLAIDLLLVRGSRTDPPVAAVAVPPAPSAPTILPLPSAASSSPSPTAVAAPALASASATPLASPLPPTTESPSPPSGGAHRGSSSRTATPTSSASRAPPSPPASRPATPAPPDSHDIF
jgi:serine/threonine-protein kinase